MTPTALIRREARQAVEAGCTADTCRDRPS